MYAANFFLSLFHHSCTTSLPDTKVLHAGGGVWAVYPVVFSISFLCGTFHSVLTFILSVATLSSYFSAAFRVVGPPPSALWGSYPVVGKDSLENYTFCIYCARPKSPRTHHCRTCGTCVLDMDHHCPFVSISQFNNDFDCYFTNSYRVVLCSFKVHMMSFGSDDCKVCLQLDAMTYILC